MHALAIKIFIYINIFYCLSNNDFNNKLCSFDNHKRSGTELQITFVQSRKDTTIEDKILDKVYKLPEVREKELFIDSMTNHKSGISLIIYKKPTPKESYYWVQAGYDNKIRFEPYLNFYVFKKNLEIKYYDPSNGHVLTLDEWRSKAQSRPVSQNPYSAHH